MSHPGARHGLACGDKARTRALSAEVPMRDGLSDGSKVLPSAPAVRGKGMGGAQSIERVLRMPFRESARRVVLVLSFWPMVPLL